MKLGSFFYNNVVTPGCDSSHRALALTISLPPNYSNPRFYHLTKLASV